MLLSSSRLAPFLAPLSPCTNRAKLKYIVAPRAGRPHLTIKKGPLEILTAQLTQASWGSH